MTSEFIIAYFLLFNIIGIMVNAVDKWCAKHDKWRIRESTLWGVALLGGAPASYLTMKVIRHKTKHKSFMTIMPILSIIDIAAFIYALIYVN